MGSPQKSADPPRTVNPSHGEEPLTETSDSWLRPGRPGTAAQQTWRRHHEVGTRHHPAATSSIVRPNTRTHAVTHNYTYLYILLRLYVRSDSCVSIRLPFDIAANVEPLPTSRCTRDASVRLPPFCICFIHVCVLVQSHFYSLHALYAPRPIRLYEVPIP